MERGRGAALLGVDSPAGAVAVCARERRRSELNDDLVRGPAVAGASDAPTTVPSPTAAARTTREESARVTGD